MRLILCSLVVVFSAGQLSGCGPSRAQPISNVVSDATTPAPTNPDWSFLVGTTWIVPPSDLNAYQLQGTGAPTGNSPTTSPPTIVRLQDQTVYQITGYENGYFWGVISVTLGVGSAGTSPVTACGTVLSPITPEGSLILGVNNSQAPLIQNWASGQMVWKSVNGTDQWTMENWKFGGYVHWAHMIQTVPGDIYYNNLPYLGTAVTDVLNAPGCASAWRPVSPS
jgi:hypothetical protein